MHDLSKRRIRKGNFEESKDVHLKTLHHTITTNKVVSLHLWSWEWLGIYPSKFQSWSSKIKYKMKFK